MDLKSRKATFQKNSNEFSRLDRDLKKVFISFYGQINERMQFDFNENGI